MVTNHKLACVLTLFIFCLFSSRCFSEPEQALSSKAANQSFVAVNVDQVSVDVDGVKRALTAVEQKLERLSSAMEKLAAAGETLNEDDQQLLVQVRQNLRDSSLSLKTLMQQLPQDAQQMSQYMDQLVQGLQSTQQSIDRLVASYPQMIEKTQQDVDESVDHFFNRVIWVLIVLGLILLIVLGVTISMLYKNVLQPMTHIVDTFAKFPEQQQKTASMLDEISIRLEQLAKSEETQSKALPKPESQTDSNASTNTE